MVDDRIPAVTAERRLGAADSSDRVSPGFVGVAPGGPVAREMKFAIDEDASSRLERALAAHLAPDPHTDPSWGGYRVTSLYLDTPGFDVFRRPRLVKYRVRRYDGSPGLFLERKARRGLRVRKRRTAVESMDGGPPEDGAGLWFRREVVRRRLRPVAAIAYDRRAFEWTGNGGPVRVTFDRAIRGTPEGGWDSFSVPLEASPLFEGVVICELKYRGGFPDAIKQILASLGLSPSGASKYRRCVDVLALAAPRAPEPRRA